MKAATIGGGWLQALDIHMQSKVDLHIAFYANWSESSFKGRDTTYHVITPDQIRTSNLKNVIRPHIIQEEDTKQYIDIVERVKPDLIHIHGTENSYATILQHVNIPVLVSIQGLMDPYAYRLSVDSQGDMQVHISKSGRNVKTLLFERSQKHQFELLQLMGIRERKYMKQTRNFMGRTDWDRRVCQVVSPDSRYFHGDEILRNEFYHEIWKPRTERKKLIIHTTSSDSLLKGFKTVAHAAKLLKDAGFDFEWRLAGISPDSAVVRILKKQMKNEFQKLPIVLLGKMPSEILTKKLMEADVFVLPSNIENSPNSLCEAMLLSMPCISTNSGGTPSLLSDGVEGLLVQPGDPWSLAGAVMDIKNNYSRAIEMGQCARLRAVQRHDPDRIINQVMAAYQSILEEK